MRSKDRGSERSGAYCGPGWRDAAEVEQTWGCFGGLFANVSYQVCGSILLDLSMKNVRNTFVMDSSIVLEKAAEARQRIYSTSGTLDYSRPLPSHTRQTRGVNGRLSAVSTLSFIERGVMLNRSSPLSP